MESQQQRPSIPEEARPALLYLAVSILIVSAILSVVIVMALTIPLWIQLKDGSFHRRRSSSLQRRGSDQQPYSTYNLYLVYLAIMDLAYLLPTIIALINQDSHPRFYIDLYRVGFPNVLAPPVDIILNLPYIFANMWLNAVIAYEVWILLQKTSRSQRIMQPSLRRVNCQAAGVILASVVYGLLIYYNMMLGWVGPTTTLWIIYVVSNTPLVYVIGVTIFVKYRGYLPSLRGATTPNAKAVRGLAIYFFRVCLVFVFIWFPVGLFWIFINMGHPPDIISICGMLLTSIQPIATFCTILTKPDVKKYIKDFCAMTYLFGDNGSCLSCWKSHDKPNEHSGLTLPPLNSESAANERKSTPATRRSTILGYNFTDLDFDTSIVVDVDDQHDDDNGIHDHADVESSGVPNNEPRSSNGSIAMSAKAQEANSVEDESANIVPSDETTIEEPSA